jgi:hypothetical protein
LEADLLALQKELKDVKRENQKLKVELNSVKLDVGALLKEKQKMQRTINDQKD